MPVLFSFSTIFRGKSAGEKPMGNVRSVFSLRVFPAAPCLSRPITAYSPAWAFSGLGKNSSEVSSRNVYGGWEKTRRAFPAGTFTGAGKEHGGSCQPGRFRGLGKNSSEVSSRNVYGGWEKTQRAFPAGTFSRGGETNAPARFSLPLDPRSFSRRSQSWLDNSLQQKRQVAG